MDTGQPFDALLIQLNRMLGQPEVGPAIFIQKRGCSAPVRRRWWTGGR